MRVIAGKAKGARLKTEAGDKIRPTADRVKESMFSIIQFYLEGANALDLFCGSGALGIEALSRGAKSCVFVDGREKSLKTAAENLEKTKLSEAAKLCCSGAAEYIKTCRDRFDVIFLDPPYKKGLIPGILKLIDTCNILSKDGIIICESHQGDEMPEQAGELSREKTYRYGQVFVTTFSKRGKNE